jgi:hypothetical protein
MPSAEFKPAIPATKQPQTYALDPEATFLYLLQITFSPQTSVNDEFISILMLVLPSKTQVFPHESVISTNKQVSF